MTSRAGERHTACLKGTHSNTRCYFMGATITRKSDATK